MLYCVGFLWPNTKDEFWSCCFVITACGVALDFRGHSMKGYSNITHSFLLHFLIHFGLGMLITLNAGPWFNIKMSSYQCKSHCGDKTILRPSYFHNGISYTGKMASLYWIGTLLLKPEYSRQTWSMATADDFAPCRLPHGRVSNTYSISVMRNNTKGRCIFIYVPIMNSAQGLSVTAYWRIN